MPADFRRDTSKTNKNQEDLASYLICFEETDPNLETRASGEAGVDPPHYVGVA